MKRWLVVLALFVACSSSGWTEAQEDEWLDSCEAQGGSSLLCLCVMQKAKADDMTFEDMAEGGANVGFDYGFECGQEGRV